MFTVSRDPKNIFVACKKDGYLIIGSKLILMKIYHETINNVYFYVPRQYNV